MSDHHHHRRSPEQPAVSADRGALLKTVIHLWPLSGRPTAAI